MKKQRVEALHQALELLERGQSPSECLATLAKRGDLSDAELQYLAAELRTAAALRAAHKPVPRADFRRALKAEVVQLASTTEVERPGIFWPRLAALRALPLGLALLLSLGSVIVISADTRPGHPLHPLQPISRAIIQQLERGAGPVLDRLGLDSGGRATDVPASVDSSEADADGVDGSSAPNDAAPGGRSSEVTGSSHPTLVARRGSPSLSTSDRDPTARRSAGSPTPARLASAGGIPSLPTATGPEFTTTAPAPATSSPRPEEPDPSSGSSDDPDPTRTEAVPAATATAEATATDSSPVVTTEPTTAVVPPPPSATASPSPQPLCIETLQGTLLNTAGDPFPTPMQPITITALGGPNFNMPILLGRIALDGRQASYRLELESPLCPGVGPQSLIVVALNADSIEVGAHIDPSRPGEAEVIPVQDLEPSTELPVTIFGLPPGGGGGRLMPCSRNEALGRVEGRVRDGAGDSIPAAWVHLIDARSQEDPPLGFMAESDARGQFRFDEVCLGDYVILGIADPEGPQPRYGFWDPNGDFDADILSLSAADPSQSGIELVIEAPEPPFDLPTFNLRR